MKKVLAYLVLVFTVLVFQSRYAAAENYDFDELKEWETSIMVGYKNMTDSRVSDAASLAVRTQNRIGYPFLLGVEGEASVIGDVAYFRVGVPFTARVGLVDKLKLDLTVSPGGLYAWNTTYDINHIAPAVSVGGEIKYFYKSGYSFGLGLYYTKTTKHIDNYNFVFTVGF